MAFAASVPFAFEAVAAVAPVFGVVASAFGTAAASASEVVVDLLASEAAVPSVLGVAVVASFAAEEAAVQGHPSTHWVGKHPDS